MNIHQNPIKIPVNPITEHYVSWKKLVPSLPGAAEGCQDSALHAKPWQKMLISPGDMVVFTKKHREIT